MADEKKEQPQNGEPPKIKLNGNGKHHTDKIPPVTPNLPPKVKFETTRIKLETAKLHVPPPAPEGEPAKSATAPGGDLPITTTPDVVKKQTSRVQMPGAAPTSASTPKKATARVELPETVSAAPTTAKKATNRVQLPDTVLAQPAPAVLKKQTTRIELSGGGTTSADTQGAKKTTARIELGDVTKIASPGSSQQIPRTVRIKQSELPPTVAARKIPEIISAGGMEEARKSETARIELPPETIVEQPVTRRKTIRIKRPGAEGELPPAMRVPTTIARATPTVAPTQTAHPEAAPEEELIAATPGAEEEASLLAMLCAAAAFIVTTVLVYVLAAQTIAVNLPFPGKV